MTFKLITRPRITRSRSPILILRVKILKLSSLRLRNQMRGNEFFYNELDHWKRNCKLYLEDLKKKKGSETTSLGIHAI